MNASCERTLTETTGSICRLVSEQLRLSGTNHLRSRSYQNGDWYEMTRWAES